MNCSLLCGALLPSPFILFKLKDNEPSQRFFTPLPVVTFSKQSGLRIRKKVAGAIVVDNSMMMISMPTERIAEERELDVIVCQSMKFRCPYKKVLLTMNSQTISLYSHLSTKNSSSLCIIRPPSDPTLLSFIQPIQRTYILFIKMEIIYIRIGTNPILLGALRKGDVAFLQRPPDKNLGRSFTVLLVIIKRRSKPRSEERTLCDRALRTGWSLLPARARGA